jgi:hypothetical protein
VQQEVFQFYLVTLDKGLIFPEPICAFEENEDENNTSPWALFALFTPSINSYLVPYLCIQQIFTIPTSWPHDMVGEVVYLYVFSEGQVHRHLI